MKGGNTGTVEKNSQKEQHAFEFQNSSAVLNYASNKEKNIYIEFRFIPRHWLIFSIFTAYLNEKNTVEKKILEVEIRLRSFPSSIIFISKIKDYKFDGIKTL